MPQASIYTRILCEYTTGSFKYTQQNLYIDIDNCFLYHFARADQPDDEFLCSSLFRDVKSVGRNYNEQV